MYVILRTTDSLITQSEYDLFVCGLWIYHRLMTEFCNIFPTTSGCVRLVAPQPLRSLVNHGGFQGSKLSVFDGTFPWIQLFGVALIDGAPRKVWHHKQKEGKWCPGGKLKIQVNGGSDKRGKLGEAIYSQERFPKSMGSWLIGASNRVSQASM